MRHATHDDFISLQKVFIRTDKLKTLNYQKLLGNINWIRPYLKSTIGELSPLFLILHGDKDPQSARCMAPKGLKALALVEQRVSAARVKQIVYINEWDLLILKTPFIPTRCLWQEGVLE